MTRPRDWWPLSAADPVPGDPGVLAGLGGHMADAAAEIQRMAAALPKLGASELWDSAAGQQFRDKAATTAAGLGKAHGRFKAVATALGSSTYGGAGYAAALQECQDQADAALTAVTGTLSTSGSESDRRRAWAALVAATGGLDPSRPLPQSAAAGNSPGPFPVLPALQQARVPAGPMPSASPGAIPPHLPGFPADPADVTALKRSYNAAVDQLAASARSITRAAAAQQAAAHTAAQLIRTATQADGLNNPSGFLHWLEHEADNVTGYVSAHWAGFTRALADIAGEIATECGVIAMVLAFIPGMQEFAAAFETIALLAQFVSFACHLTLLATGNGGLLDVVVDGIGLVTFGVGKGLIGSAEATAEISESVSSAYRETVGEGDDVTGLIDAGDVAVRELTAQSAPRVVDKLTSGTKSVLSVRPVFRAAFKAFREGKVGEALGARPLATVGRGFRLASPMNSPEIGFALSKASDAAAEMPFAQGVAWVTTSRIETYATLFKATQYVGVGTDLTSKLDSALNAGHLTLPGYDAIKNWPGQGGS